jgi:hypothetical protein
MFFATAATATATATAATARTRPAGSGEEAVDAKGHSEPGVSQAPPRHGIPIELLVFAFSYFLLLDSKVALVCLRFVLDFCVFLSLDSGGSLCGVWLVDNQ